MSRSTAEQIEERQAQVEVAWRGGAHYSITAEEAKAALEEVRETRGRLDAETVVAEASNPVNPLHRCFTWDDTQAAHAHRLWQARNLMGSIVVRHLDRDKPPIGRLYVAVHTKEQEPLREYVQATTIRGISPERAQAIEEARRLLMGIRRRFAYLSELEAVWDALDEEIG